jgi:signal transduction histidine kinase
MDFRNFSIGLAIRLGMLFPPLIGLSFSIATFRTWWLVLSVILLIVVLFVLFRFTIRRMKEMSYFLESIKYRDFSRQFSEVKDSPDIIEMHKGFNNTIETIKEINLEKETQFLYLQKILEIIDTGIICFEQKTGDIMMINKAFREILDIPGISNITFIQKRFPEAYEKLFIEKMLSRETLSIRNKKETLSYLTSNAIFAIQETKYKLIAVQNIELNLSQNETDAWKKLLSVMTHEIMNSIAPISSLAETLRNNIIDENKKIDMDDLQVGIESIQNRSEGLLKFAQTYRTLSKITHINKDDVSVYSLFHNIKNLLLPSLDQKGIKLAIKMHSEEMMVRADKHLIEQVLINLILNAVEAFPLDREDKSIMLSASQSIEKRTEITVSDNGVGIHDVIKDQIFVPFFTTKKEGNGIGLSLCKQIMTLHKGHIQVHSNIEKGTRVKLLFAP